MISTRKERRGRQQNDRAGHASTVCAGLLCRDATGERGEGRGGRPIRSPRRRPRRRTPCARTRTAGCSSSSRRRHLWPTPMCAAAQAVPCQPFPTRSIFGPDPPFPVEPKSKREDGSRWQRKRLPEPAAVLATQRRSSCGAVVVFRCESSLVPIRVGRSPCGQVSTPSPLQHMNPMVTAELAREGRFFSTACLALKLLPAPASPVVSSSSSILHPPLLPPPHLSCSPLAIPPSRPLPLRACNRLGRAPAPPAESSGAGSKCAALPGQCSAGLDHAGQPTHAAGSQSGSRLGVTVLRRSSAVREIPVQPARRQLEGAARPRYARAVRSARCPPQRHCPRPLLARLPRAQAAHQPRPARRESRRRSAYGRCRSQGFRSVQRSVVSRWLYMSLLCSARCGWGRSSFCRPTEARWGRVGRMPARRGSSATVAPWPHQYIM